MRISTKAMFLPIAAVLLLASPAYAAPTISANPNPVNVAAGETQGAVIISWDAENNKDAEVWLQVDGDETKFFGAQKDSQAAIITVGKTHTFKLYKDSKRNTVLASVAVNAVQVVAAASPASSNKSGTYRKLPGGKIGNQDKVTNHPLAIRNMQIIPQVGNAVIAFTSVPGGTAILQLAKIAPVMGADDFWKFPSNSGASVYPIVPTNTPTHDLYTLNFAARNQDLEQGAKYFYILDVYDANKNHWQSSGDFTTLAQIQNVKVVFTRIRLLSPAKPKGLYFDFSAGTSGSTGVGQDEVYNSLGAAVDSPLKWESGAVPKPIQLELLVDNSPNRLRLVVIGGYSDNNDFYILPDATFENLASGPEWNYAKGEFDLSNYPGANAVQYFTLQSLPLNGNGNELAFDVIGRIEITRTTIKPMAMMNNTTAAPPSEKPIEKAPSLKDRIRDRIHRADSKK